MAELVSQIHFRTKIMHYAKNLITLSFICVITYQSDTWGIARPFKR